MFKSKTCKLLRRQQRQQQQQQQQQAQTGPKQAYLKAECHRTYSCIHCRAHLANHDELISKLFQGNHGRAYLFNKVVNIGCKQAVERELLTGLHAVADIYCDCCETTLGWKYEQAFVPSQKYKEGKYIIELVHMLKENNWDLTSYNSNQLLSEADGKGEENDEELGRIVIELHPTKKSSPKLADNEHSFAISIEGETKSREPLAQQQLQQQPLEPIQSPQMSGSTSPTAGHKTSVETMATTRETIRINDDKVTQEASLGIH